MLSYQAMGLRQRTQWERGLTTLRLRGQRWMHTLRKLPMRRPKRSAMRASIMELPDHVRQAGSPWRTLLGAVTMQNKLWGGQDWPMPLVFRHIGNAAEVVGQTAWSARDAPVP